MDKIKSFIQNHRILSFILCVLFFYAVHILCRGDYGYNDDNKRTVERIEKRLERANERIADSQSKLGDIEEQLDRATGTSNEIGNGLSELGKSVDESKGIIDESQSIIDGSTERDRRMQERFADIERAN